MDLIKAAVLGLVEGITEFLPISSTAHLILVSKFLKIPQTDFQKFFEVFIQSGAIIAVFFMYLKYIMNHQKIQLKILASFIPTAIIGMGLFNVIKGVFFESGLLMISALFIIAIVFLILENLIKKGKLRLDKIKEKISYRDAVLVGLIQALSIIPGVSRAGIVMVGMMLLGYKRKDAAEYSFLLSIPTILAAAFYDVYKVGPLLFLYSNRAAFLVTGFIVSFISAYIVVKWFIGYLKKNTLTPFAIYRILLAIILLLIGAGLVA